MEINPDRASAGSDSAPSQDNASKQQLKTFHPFPRLPQEIKDMIWEMAIRPAYDRGVQRFSIVREEIFRSGYDSDYDFDSDDNSESESESESGFDLELKSKREPGPAFASRSASESNEEPRAVRWAKPFDSRTNRGIQVVLGRSHRISASRSYHFLAAPKVPDSGQTTYSWKYPANKSTYTWDMGLWQASRASREAMMKHYNPTFWARESRSFTKDDEKLTPFLLSDAPVLAQSDEGGETLPILTHPNTDLFILDLKDFPIGVNFDLVFDNISDMIGRSKTTCTYNGIQHVGIQYNSQLWTDCEEWLCPPDSDFAALMRLLNWAIERRLEDKPAPYIWLIEERLWRWEQKIYTTNGIAGREHYRKPRKFHEIGGEIYTETNESNIVRSSDEGGVLSYPSALQFMLRLQSMTEHLEPVDEDRFLELDPDLTGGSDWDLQPHAGFLTCKTLDPNDPKNKDFW